MYKRQGLLGAGTLRDISLALFIGIIVGTLSTLFLQAPLYALLRRGDADVRDQDARVGRDRDGLGQQTDLEDAHGAVL